MITLSYILMVIDGIGSILLLWLLRNGHRPNLAGIRWMLRVFCCVPLVGIMLNGVMSLDVIPLTILLPLRICIGYTLIGVATWGFVIWLLRG